MKLAEEVVKWWEDHRYDVHSNGEEEYNVFDEPPKFVELAYKELGLEALN